MLKTAIGFKAIRGLANLGKSAIGFGSAITEIENVVDVSFGSMADEAYKFASTAKEQFGLSELAAKQYSGTMMAMMKSSGVAQDAASKMSISLAGLAGDIASFYNIDTDTAFQKIRAGISGEIEPLRQLVLIYPLQIWRLMLFQGELQHLIMQCLKLKKLLFDITI